MLFQLGQPPAYETWRILLTISGSFVALFFGAVTAFVIYRTKTAETYKSERDAYKDRAERLEKENTTYKEKVAVLEAQRDLTSVQEGQAAIVRAVESLAANETERFTKVMSLLDTYQQTATETVTLLKGMNSR